MQLLPRVSLPIPSACHKVFLLSSRITRAPLVAFAVFLTATVGIQIVHAAPQQPPTVAVNQPAEGRTYYMESVLPYEFRGDLRDLPQSPFTGAASQRQYRPLLTPPRSTKFAASPAGAAPESPSTNTPLAPMPSPIQNFDGLSFSDLCGGVQCGAGWPPDTNGDVGLNHYIEAVNDAYAIYSKTGTLLASFTENQLWSPSVSNPCNGNSRGDPVVLYDQLADRWILTHLAFTFSSGSPVSPFYECIAVSKTSDPVAGGWWLYPLRMDPGGSGPPTGALNDYPKFGIWPDCLYMAANEFTYPSVTLVGTAYASFSRADLESGATLTWSLGFLPYLTSPSFTMIPSNLRGTSADAMPPSVTPNYFVSESTSAFNFEVRKFTAGPNCGGGGTLSAPTMVSQTSYSPPPDGTGVVPQPNTSDMLDALGDRLMQKVQYRKVGSAESLWVVHSVQTSPTSTVNPQWAQIDVTGGTISATPVQQQIYAPDATLYRWMGSIAADKQGNVALGYSTSNGAIPNFPSIAYSGRLATDPPNSLPQTETQLVAGAGSQTGISRWGDYTAMSVDPADDCTFWYTNEHYSSPANGDSGNWQTRIGSFRFPSCAAPAVTLNPTSVAFNNQLVSMASATSNVQLTNSGGGTLNIASITLTGTNSSDFSLVAPTSGSPACLLGASSINPGSSCFFGVKIQPTSIGAKSASVSVSDDAPGTPHTIALTGTGIAPAVTLSMTSVPLGNVNVGTASATSNVQLTNSGTAPLNVTSITLTGTDISQFALAAPISGSPACSFGANSINPGSSCFFGMKFQPTSTGAKSASVTVASDASGNPNTAVLSGSGVDFAVTGPPAAVTVIAGHPANFTISLTTGGGPTLNPTTFSATGNPAHTTVTFNPQSVPAGSTTASTTMTIATTARSNALPSAPSDLWPQPLFVRYFIVFFMLGWAIVVLKKSRRLQQRKLIGAYAMFAGLLAFAALAGCGGSNSGGTGGAAVGTAAGSSIITVTAASGSVSRTTTATLTVQ